MTLQVSPVEQAVRLRTTWSANDSYDDAQWPTAAWNECVSAGVTRWVISHEYGGDGASAAAVVEGCLELARGHLLVAFILSQFQAACQRLVIARSYELRERWLPKLANGECFTTVGISHLTTSRQHTSPAVIAEPHANGCRLTGEIPWVTGARRADVLVIGGTLPDGGQVLAAVPSDRPGLTACDMLPLLALSGSETGPIRLDGVVIHDNELIAGPMPQVLQAGTTSGAGSLTTSALALGHALACLDRLSMEAASRPPLQHTQQALQSRANGLRRQLLATATGTGDPAYTAENLRTSATDLALKASQALLTACKGAGFVRGHPAERLSREALFFLVWSCPQAVAGQLLHGFGQCADR
jgi:alkylation response protein AidB-like acyl-CoA dehydrogenase